MQLRDHVGRWLLCSGLALLGACESSQNGGTSRGGEGGEAPRGTGGDVGSAGDAAGSGSGGDRPNPPPEPTLNLPEPSAPESQLASQFADVCSPGYAGDPDAPEYNSRESGPHGMVVVREGRAHGFGAAIPEDWRPSRTQDVELVACIVNVEASRSDSCEYLNASTIRRYYTSVEVEVVSVRSGARVTEFVVGGEVPRCPDMLSEHRPELFGDPPTLDDFLRKVVQPYVPLPECFPARPVGGCNKCYETVEDARDDDCAVDLDPPSPGVVHQGRYRVGAEATLEAPFSTASLFSPSYRYDWASSSDIAELKSTTERVVVARLEDEGFHHFTVYLTLPGPGGEVVVDTFDVRVEAFPARIPIEVLGFPGNLRLGKSIELRADFEGPNDPLTGVSWSVVERPEGSQAEVSSSTIRPTLTPDLVGDYRVRVQWDDGLGATDPLTSGVLAVVNRPVASISGGDRTGRVGSTVTFEGYAGLTLNAPGFEWSLSDKPAASQIDPSVSDYNKFNVVPDVAGTYQVQLIVSDEGGTSEPAFVSLTVTE